MVYIISENHLNVNRETDFFFIFLSWKEESAEYSGSEKHFIFPEYPNAQLIFPLSFAILIPIRV